MATQYSGVIYGEYSKYNRLRINYTVSQDEVSAISTITMDLYAERTRTYRQYNNTGSSYWNLTGTGNNYIKYDWAEGSSELYLGNSAITVQHNDEGAGAVTLSGYWYTGRLNSNSIPEAISISEYVTLKNIPRKSSISMATANIGTETTITISGYSDSFVHDVYCVFGSQRVDILSGKKRGTYSWTIPESFYREIPNSKTGRGTIYCDTWIGSSKIGTASATFDVTTNESLCKPSASATLKDINEMTVGLTGKETNLIKGFSTAEISVTSEAKNYATIAKITVNGATVTDGKIVFTNVSTNTFDVIVTDSRGYYTVIPLTTEMVLYIPLTLSATFFRPLPTTGEVSVTYSGNYYSGSFGETDNILELSWKYREAETEEWLDGGTITPTINENKIVEDTISLGKIFDYRHAYEFQITAKDKLTETTRTASVSMGIPVYNWSKDFFNVNVDLRHKNKSIFGTVLFENINGDNGETLRLNDTIENYKSVKIDYVISMSQYLLNDSKTTLITNGSCVSLNLIIAHSEALQLFVSGRYLFSGNTVTKQFSTRSRIVNDKTIDWDGNVSIWITKITGYNY